MIWRFIPIGILAMLALGCSGDPEPKPDSNAPAVKYQMVPATTGGTGNPAPSTTPPASTPNPTSTTGNPPSAGSD